MRKKNRMEIPGRFGESIRPDGSSSLVLAIVSYRFTIIAFRMKEVKNAWRVFSWKPDDRVDLSPKTLAKPLMVQGKREQGEDAAISLGRCPQTKTAEEHRGVEQRAEAGKGRGFSVLLK